mmetsp:Transcript_12465/g.29731  ORF Transcript_12465/g.29731 Transcript_12465/m.29731 type:complete len:81 (+) Transcript_12465:1567-1809(+)
MACEHRKCQVFLLDASNLGMHVAGWIRDLVSCSWTMRSIVVFFLQQLAPSAKTSVYPDDRSSATPTSNLLSTNKKIILSH